MAKPLFKNYTYTFDKNEKKILLNFCKSMQKQMAGDEKFYQDLRSIQSLIDKLNSGEFEIKLTREEKTKLVFRLKENIENLKKEMKKGFFIRRWIYKSAYTQYNNLLINHFTD
jgi:hypothetical protein